MNNTYYALNFYDYSAPSFCSFTKLYVGRKDDFLKFADNLSKTNYYSETAEAIKAFFAGDENSKCKLYSQEMSVLTPVEVVLSSDMVLKNHEWEHINVWGFPYPLKADFASISQILIKYSGKFVRCIRAKFTGLYYESFFHTRYEALDSVFGLKENFEFSSIPSGEKHLKNILFIEEDKSDSIEGQEQNMKDPDKIKLKTICDDMFGDG